ncbi:transposase [Staphylococcus capitis]|uniref:transposase n=1 Tax=Staphylococcus capitis TaxID=29388 RepID=UPI003D092E8E
MELPGVGTETETETAGQLLVTAGDNPNRRASEASFAHLCAAAPVSGSSGRTDRHRLSRGGLRLAWVVRQSESRPIMDHRRNSLPTTTTTEYLSAVYWTHPPCRLSTLQFLDRVLCGESG